MDDPIWISKELVLAIHSRQLAEHGGSDGVRDEGLLESALARPRNRFAYEDPTPDIASLSASYAFGIAQIMPSSTETSGRRTSSAEHSYF